MGYLLFSLKLTLILHLNTDFFFLMETSSSHSQSCWDPKGISESSTSELIYHF